jgi:acetyltransferase-like isoleucine patch superfamily enzyme
LPEFAAGGFTHVMVCSGSNRTRARSFEFGRKMGLQAATLIHPSAVISPSAEIGVGTVVMPRVVVNAGAKAQTIGAGAVVLRHVAAGATVVGVPAKPRPPLG